jgi:1-deoxy-D-xylulose-5-phosphate reductoisomerase
MPVRQRTVTLLGSTGSIGDSAIALIKAQPEHYRIRALTAYNNVEKLAAQAKELRPDLVVIGNEALFTSLKERLKGEPIACAAGPQAIIEAAQIPTDVVLAGIVGAAGLAPIFAAVRRGATIGIANKEPLVCAGDLIRKESQKFGATLLPVDSEHNAIFQVFDFQKPETVSKIILTASGGPFLRTPLEDMVKITAAQAVKHPNWSMGAKISVDSATMMNKALEMIEAYHLFPVKAEQIDTIIHPESIIHSMVEYHDGSVLAQMGAADMTIPIAYALAWPQRLPTPVKRLNLAEIGSLHFHAPDEQRFPALNLVKHVLQRRGILPIIFNAANEIAVEQFLENNISYLNIVEIVATCLEDAEREQFTTNTLEDILSIDGWARTLAYHNIKKAKQWT